jgi:hypothetical protein
MNSDNGILVHCLLGKNSRYQVAWISENLATIGNIVDLIDERRHDPGWRVISAGDRRAASTVRRRTRSSSTSTALGV